MIHIQRDIGLNYTLCHQVTRLGAQRTLPSNGLDPEGQVPMATFVKSVSNSPFTSYALLGSGRLARHLQSYLKSLNCPVVFWSRNGDPEFNSVQEPDSARRLTQTLKDRSHVLLAVSDPALPELANSTLPGQTVVHFSGCAQVPGVFAAHPLMTFGAEVQDLEWYRRIPFVVDTGVDFSRILPGFTNPAFSLEPGQRALYHALCALAGNSTFLLWQKITEVFEQQLELPSTVLSPFLHQVVTNALRPERSARATGPVARGDWDTVRAHLDALAEKPTLLAAYRQFLHQAGQSGFEVPEALL